MVKGANVHGPLKATMALSIGTERLAALAFKVSGNNHGRDRLTGKKSRQSLRGH